MWLFQFEKENEYNTSKPVDSSCDILNMDAHSYCINKTPFQFCSLAEERTSGWHNCKTSVVSVDIFICFFVLFRKFTKDSEQDELLDYEPFQKKKAPTQGSKPATNASNLDAPILQLWQV